MLLIISAVVPARRPPVTHAGVSADVTWLRSTKPSSAASSCPPAPSKHLHKGDVATWYESRFQFTKCAVGLSGLLTPPCTLSAQGACCAVVSAMGHATPSGTLDVSFLLMLDPALTGGLVGFAKNPKHPTLDEQASSVIIKSPQLCRLKLKAEKGNNASVISRAEVTVPPDSQGHGDVAREVIVRCSFEESVILSAIKAENPATIRLGLEGLFEMGHGLPPTMRLFRCSMERPRTVYHISVAKRQNQPETTFDTVNLAEHARFHLQQGVDLLAFNTHMFITNDTSAVMDWVRTPGVFALPIRDLMSTITPEWTEKGVGMRGGTILDRLFNSAQGHNLQINEGILWCQAVQAKWIISGDLDEWVVPHAESEHSKTRAESGELSIILEAIDGIVSEDVSWLALYSRQVAPVLTFPERVVKASRYGLCFSHPKGPLSRGMDFCKSDNVPRYFNRDFMPFNGTYVGRNDPVKLPSGDLWPPLLKLGSVGSIPRKKITAHQIMQPPSKYLTVTGEHHMSHGKWIGWVERLDFGHMHYAGPSNGLALPPWILGILHFRSLGHAKVYSHNNGANFADKLQSFTLQDAENFCSWGSTMKKWRAHCGWCELHRCDYLGRFEQQ